MSPKPISFALVAALTVVAARGLSSAAERHAPTAQPARAVVVSVQRVEPMPARSFDPAKAFNDLGCSGCHGDDGIYRDEIKGALGKPVDRVARWIRNAPSIKPDTDMPNFEKLIDEPSSIALAGYMLDRAAHLE